MRRPLERLTTGEIVDNLTADATHVYFGLCTDHSGPPRIARIPLTGGEMEVVTTGDDACGPGMVVAGSHLYIADSFSIRRVPVGGGPSELVIDATHEMGPLAADYQYLYFSRSYVLHRVRV